MRKSKDITKYELDWQIIRSSIKGGKVEFQTKLNTVSMYLSQCANRQRKERVLNFLEGLAMGYRKKDQAKHDACLELRYGLEDTIVTEEDEVINEDFSKYSEAQLVHLWKDLFARNKVWLKKGYVHVEHNDFTDRLYQHVRGVKLVEKHKIELEKLRLEASQMDNTHNFFF